MINLKINNRSLEVPSGTSVLNAARQLGIEIPTMCYHEGFTNHPSCMLCLVKDTKSGKLHPSCALPAKDGMVIITDDDGLLAGVMTDRDLYKHSSPTVATSQEKILHRKK